MYDHILLPTDGSASMQRVIDHVGALARVHEASVHALYVVDSVNLSTLPTGSSIESIHGLLEEEAEAALNTVEHSLPEDVSAESTIEEGSPGEKIIEHASTVDCDVIGMGTHGRGGIDRLLLGSVAEHVVRRSPVPVLTVRVDPEMVGGEAKG